MWSTLTSTLPRPAHDSQEQACSAPALEHAPTPLRLTGAGCTARQQARDARARLGVAGLAAARRRAAAGARLARGRRR